MVKKRSLWLSVLTALLLVFTMAFSNPASAEQPAKDVEKDYIVGFKSSVKTATVKKMSLKKAAEKWTSNSRSSTPQKRRSIRMR